MIKDKKIKYFTIISSLIMAFVMFFCIAGNNIVYGASATISISSATATQGQEVSVTVSINADASIGAYNFYLEYDPAILEVVSGHDGGGGGRIQLQYDVPNLESISKSLTKTITFKAIAPGTSAIKYVSVNEDDGVLDYDTTDNMAITPSDGSVTVKAPVIASKNNNLASMTVAAVKGDGTTFDVNLTPGFSKDVTTYNLSLEEGITKLVISATTEDSKASIRIQWPNLDPGDNTTNIFVTAEDGSTKKYTIYTKVALPPETTTVPPEPITVVIGGEECFIEDITDGVSLPEGFETFEMNYEGETVIAGRGLSKNLTIMYITKGDGSAGSLYIYNEADKSFYQMVNIEMTQKLYTVIKAPAELLVPAGFVSTPVTINGITFDGWRNEEIQGVYLVYAMNWNGETGLYYYDEVEKQMIKYFEISVQAGASIDEYNKLVAENTQLRNQLASAENGDSSASNEDDQLYKYITYGCTIIIIILIGVIIVLASKKNREDNNDGDDHNDEDEDDDDEDEDDDDEDEDDDDNDGDDEDDEHKDDSSVEDKNVEEIPLADDSENVVMVSVTAVDNDEEVEKEAEEESKTEEKTEVEGETEKQTSVETQAEIETEEEAKEELEIVPEVKLVESEVQEEEVEKETEKEILEESIDAELEYDLKNAVAGIFEEETSDDGFENEFSEEIAVSEVSQVTEKIEEVQEEIVISKETEIVENEEIQVQVEETIEESTETEENETSVDKKKLVRKILDDEETSIKEGDIDLVIDELFDELFGE